MAVAQIDFMSQTLNRTVSFWAVIPAESAAQPLYKTFYYLHGMTRNPLDLLSYSSVRKLADEKRIAIIMPAGENSAYMDDSAAGANYAQFVGSELVEISRKLFPLSHKREDTFIGGFSMGGFGAIRNGCFYSENFGRIVGISSALVGYDVPGSTEDTEPFYMSKTYFERIFGDVSMFEESMNNPETVIKTRQAEERELPPLYLACGTEDFLIEHNRKFARFLEENNVPHVYIEDTGGHTWEFTEEYLPKALDWLTT